MLSLVHMNHKLQLNPDSLIIIENVNEDQYNEFANEDLKLDYDGVCLYIHSPATYEHEQIVYTFLNLFKQFLSSNPGVGHAVGSRFSIKLKNGKRPEPDIAILPYGTVDKKSAMYEGNPLLVVEILSPSNADHDYNRKRFWYQENEIPEIWYLNLENYTLEVFTLQDGTYIKNAYTENFTSSLVLKNFQLDILNLKTIE